MKNREDLKKQVLECARESRAATVERLKFKASDVDHQSTDYQKSMLDLWLKRQGCRDRGRLANLAYGFRRGVPYLAMEAKTNEPLYAHWIADIVGVSEDEVSAWLNAGQKEEAA